jgi:hypothetical protein
MSEINPEWVDFITNFYNEDIWSVNFENNRFIATNKHDYNHYTDTFVWYDDLYHKLKLSKPPCSKELFAVVKYYCDDWFSEIYSPCFYFKDEENIVYTIQLLPDYPKVYFFDHGLYVYGETQNLWMEQSLFLFPNIVKQKLDQFYLFSIKALREIDSNRLEFLFNDKPILRRFEIKNNEE